MRHHVVSNRDCRNPKQTFFQPSQAMFVLTEPCWFQGHLGRFPALFAATKSEYFSQEASPFPAVVLWKQKWRNINETFCGFTETSSSNIYSGDPVVS